MTRFGVLAVPEAYAPIDDDDPPLDDRNVTVITGRDELAEHPAGAMLATLLDALGIP